MKIIKGISILLFTLFISGCVTTDEMVVNRAVVRIFPTEGSDVSGLLTIEKTEQGLVVKGKIMGLTPGLHGFHVHESGDLSLTNGKSAGGHFNPYNEMHGDASSDERHIGDLGNIEADEYGKAIVNIMDNQISFKGKTSILGRAIIIHAKKDDFGQPTGNAGSRVGYGVIGMGK